MGADATDPTIAENRWGNDYGVELRLAEPPPSVDRAVRRRRTLAIIWNRPELDGPSPDVYDRHEAIGTATMPCCGAKVLCRSVWTTLTDETFDEVGPDHVSLLLPLGALERSGCLGPRVAVPPPEWSAVVDPWLVGIAQEVFAEIPISAGVVGFDPDVPEDEVIPKRRWYVHLRPEGSTLRPIDRS